MKSRKFLGYVGLTIAIAAIFGCRSQEGSRQSTPSAVKWHPGHYVNGYFGNGSAGWILKLIGKNENIKGASFIHLWRDLEPEKNVYDFSAIKNELTALKSINKRLIIQIADKTFSAHRPNCVPDYILQDPSYHGGQSVVTTKEGRFRGCVALRWVPEVQDRMMALYRELGRHFDSDPNFEAVMLEEDVVNEGGTNMGEYTSRIYTDQQKRGMSALADAFPNTVVYKFLNWGPNVGELFAFALKVGIGVGGPDLIPNERTFATPFYRQYAGKIPLEISVQDPRVRRYMHEGGTVEKLYDFGITDPGGLQVNHLVWDPVEATGLSFKNHILPLLASRSGQINDALPCNMKWKANTYGFAEEETTDVGVQLE